ncbi:hypothetical protein ACLOJK_015779 [Asimina triloba]
MANIAEAAVSSLVNTLGDQLSQEENSLSLLGVRDKVEWVETQFRWIQAFLKDAEAKSDKDERVKNWMKEVRNVTYVAEDIIDTFLVEIAPSVQQGVSGTFVRINARHKLVSEIERMKDKIRSISESRVAYGIEDIRREEGTSTASQSCRDRRLLSPFVEEPDFVGFQADQEKLMEQLMQGKQQRCSVTSIVGMGGQGKTTLARKLYQSDAIKGHFDFCTWISVSQVYGVIEILQALKKNCMGSSSSQNVDACELRHEIAQHLKGKRYFVVLDDIWTREAWDDLKDTFPNTSNGSKVLITTRNKDVALHADPISKPHELRFLDQDESWELFLKKAFLGHEPNFPIDSEPLRKEVLNKCQGLPLAIVVIGGLLSRRKEPREWQNIINSISWQLIQGENRISGILYLSYRDLPYYLKPCFLYLGIFPEDCEIPAKKLIRLWVAEGFFQERGALTLEEVGEECLNELLRRSLIQVTATSSSGAIKRFCIHDLLRDFAVSKAEEDAFLRVHSLAAAFKPCKSRRLAIHKCERFIFSNHSPPNLRSLFIPFQSFRWMFDGIVEKLVSGTSKLLRVLDIQGMSVSELPSEIGELIHLRYLGCCVDSGRLPPNIGNLVNLQTLLVSSTPSVSLSYIIRIPTVTVEMKQLRHVQAAKIYGVRGWIEMDGRPCLDKKLWSNNNSLQTLKKVVAGEWMNDGFLGTFTKLRELGINISPILRSESAEKAWKSIMKLKSLESLYVVGDVERGLGRVPPLNHLPKLCKLKLEGRLENQSILCELPRNLTKLTLTWSRLEQDPLPILSKLENLRILKLFNDSYGGQEMACTVGGFRRLQYLHFCYLDNLKELRVEKGSMPCLSHLIISSCCSLEEVPDGERIGTKFNTYLTYVELLSQDSEV